MTLILTVALLKELTATMCQPFVNLCAGFVYMLAKGYMVFEDKKYLDSAARCGEVTWEKGLLTKGPGKAE